MNPNRSVKTWLQATGVGVALVGSLLLAAACANVPNTAGGSLSESTFTSLPGDRPIVAPGEQEGYRPFHSDQLHAQVTLPPGWVGVEGPESLLHDLIALTAFNSWGGNGYWAQAVGEECCGQSYGGQGVLDQLPGDGAYVVVLDEHRKAMSSSYVEYEARDLADLWRSRDCRDGDATAGVNRLSFCKWTYCYTIEVYCAPAVSDATAEAVTSLLESWRFDAFPAGDERWARQQAFRVLPERVASLFSPVAGMGARWMTPGETMETLFAEIAVEGDGFTVNFKHRWNDPPLDTGSRECPEDRCHWWRVEVSSDGQATLLEEGGAPLP